MIFLIISTVDPINDDSDTVEYVSIHILLLTYYLLLYHIRDSYYYTVKKVLHVQDA